MKYLLLSNELELTLKPGIESEIYKLPENAEKITFVTKHSKNNEHVNKLRYTLYNIQNNKIINNHSDLIYVDKSYFINKLFPNKFTHVSFNNIFDTNEKVNIILTFKIDV